MYIYYIDEHSNIITGKTPTESTLYNVKIPVIVRHYLKLDSFAVQVGNEKDVPITHTHRKKPGNFVFYHGYLQCIGHPQVNDDWQLVMTNIPDNERSTIIDVVTPYIKYWISKHTDISWPASHPDRCNLGVNMYLKDIALSNISNCTVYNFGNSRIIRNSLSNVLIISDTELEVL